MQKLKDLLNKVRNKAIAAGLTATTLMPAGVQAQLQGGANAANPNTGAGNLTSVFQTIANTLIFLIGAVAVFMLIIGGFRYVVSGGDSESIQSAKNTILYAIIGIVVAFLSFAAVDFVIGRLGAN
ncbi:MAG: hypothetical protein WDZ81_00210 [Candidatus Saccharimonadales bacterium]